jgi:hypothetical protein
MSAITYPYLGAPGALQQLPGATGDMDSPPSRSDVTHELASGGVAITRRLNAKKTFTLPYLSRPGTGLDDLLASFYGGLFGDGPFVFVDPSVRNVLGMDTSSCGLRTNASPGWIQSAGTLTPTPTGGPTGLATGVLTWTSLSAAATLQPGLAANVADVTNAPVVLTTEATCVSLYVKASSSASMTLQLVGYDANGAVVNATTTSAVAATTAWQRFTVTAAAGAGALASSLYVLPRLVLGGSVPTSVSIAAGQVEYGTAATAWQRGYGSPRVLITSSPGRTGNFYGYTNHTLTLAEV